MAATLDHFIYAGRDLEAMSAQFEPPVRRRQRRLRVGIQRSPLGGDVYFELLAVDPTQKDKLEGTMGGRIDALPSPRLFAYMLKGQDLAEQQKVLAGHGIGADLFDASRNTPDGRTLKWRLLVPHANPLGDFVPKFIDWLDTPHPATTSNPGCTYESFVIGHPESERLCGLLTALGTSIPVETSDRAHFRLRIGSPKGPVTFVS
jgi:hypothetical protein